MGSDAVQAAPLAIPITNYNFDAQSIGDVAADGVIPGGFPNNLVESVSNPRTGTVTVQNVGTMSKAAHMVTTQSGTGAQYIDTSFNTGGATLASVDFDVNIVDVPTTGLPQATTTYPQGQAWVFQTFGAGPSAQNRVFRFVATPTSGSGGIFAMRNSTDGDLIAIGSYTEGQTYHVQVLADFVLQTVDVSLNNTLVAADLPFVSLTTSMTEHFIFQNGVAGMTNSVAIDNIVTAVPEPSSLALLGVGAIALLRRRRKVETIG